MMETLFSAAGLKVAAVATASVLLAGGAAGASAAVGGPDVTAPVHSVVAGTIHGHGGQTAQTEDGDGTGAGTGHEHCAQATQHALERLNQLKADGRPVDSAIQAIENCGKGNGGQSEAETSAGTQENNSAPGDFTDQANPNASERSDNASQGIHNANGRATTGMAHANDHAKEGSGNAP